MAKTLTSNEVKRIDDLLAAPQADPNPAASELARVLRAAHLTLAYLHLHNAGGGDEATRKIECDLRQALFQRPKGHRSTRTCGVEWKRFLADTRAWPEGAGLGDAEDMTVDGVIVDNSDIDLETLDDDALMTLGDGFVFFDDRDDVVTLEHHFKAWRRADAVRERGASTN